MNETTLLGHDGEIVERAKQAAKDQLAKAKHAVQVTEKKIQQRPLLSVLLGFLGGLVIGWAALGRRS